MVNLIYEYGLFGLFLASFLSYSVLPFPFEAGFVLALKYFNLILIFLLVLLGATLGSLLNYWIGLKGISKLIPKKEKIEKANKLFSKYGHLAILFFSWLPYIGDPLIVIAGIFKMPLKKFLLYSTFAKMWYLGILIFLGITLI